MTLKNDLLQVAHFVNLDIIGGVERDFVEFINISKRYFNSNIIVKNTLNKSFLQLFEENKVVIGSKLLNIALIKKIRNFRIFFIINKLIKSNVFIFWNTIPRYYPSNLFNEGLVLYYDYGKAWDTKCITKKRYHYFYNNASTILCISNATRRMLELRWKITNKNIKVCLSALRPSCKPINPRIKLINKNRAIVLGIAGRHVSYKGFPLVIHAAKELKKRKVPFKLLVAGVGEKSDDLKKLTVQLNIENDINFLGLVENMNEFYSQIDIFVCPSIREPFGLVNLEAMAHGCPIIVAGVDGMPEILEIANAGLVIRPTLEIEQYPEFGGSLDLFNEVEHVYDPYSDTIIRPRILDPVYVANTIEDLWSNPDTFSEMSKNAIKHVNDKFDYERHVKELYTIIEEVIRT